tara:strand:- start:46 stop:510 length:465 start_codon:yes stop_codon:yes gene_type:complete
MDAIDKNILRLLQKDVTLPLSEIANRVGISKTPCWNRIRSMEEKGIILNKIAVLDNSKVNLDVIVFLSISVSHHSDEWVETFSETVKKYDQIIEVYRVTGSNMDYLLKIAAPSVGEYDHFQQQLINEIEFSNMSSSIALKEIKRVTALPLDFCN